MRNSASLHSTKYEYFEKRRVVKRFFYAQLLTLIVFSSLLIVTVIQFIRVSVKVLTTCFISYITLDFIPTMTFSDRIQDLIEQISFTGLLMELGLVFIVELILTIVYLAMTVDIIVKLVRKRRRYNNTNFLLTRPLMEKYRNRLLKWISSFLYCQNVLWTRVLVVWLTALYILCKCCCV